MLVKIGKSIITKSFRIQLRWLCYCILILCAGRAQCAGAISLGELQTRSFLGQPLRANVPILGGSVDADFSTCVKAQLSKLDGTLITSLRVSLSKGKRTPTLTLSSRNKIEEPTFTVTLEVACETQLIFDYQVLLDPQENINNTPEAIKGIAATPLDQIFRASEAPPPPPPARLKQRKQAPAESTVKSDAALRLSQRLGNDTSPVGVASQEVFSDILSRQQNQSVLIEVSRSEIKSMQQKMQSMEIEIQRLRENQARPQAQAPIPESTPAPAVAPAVSVTVAPAVAVTPVPAANRIELGQPNEQATAEATAGNTAGTTEQTTEQATDSILAQMPDSSVEQASQTQSQVPAPVQDKKDTPGGGFPLGSAAIFGGLVILALFSGIFLYKKYKKTPPIEYEHSSMFKESDMEANSMFGANGGLNIDTSNSVFNSNFTPSASQLDTNEVDPIAEADVYIAYGRDAEAEEILKESLRTHPERNEVCLKLLEIYAHRKDTRAFEVQAGQLYSLTQGIGDDWAQAASMWMSIDPNNPLFASANAPPNIEANIAQPMVFANAQTAIVSAPPPQTFANTQPWGDGNAKAMLADTPHETAAEMNDDVESDLDLPLDLDLPSVLQVEDLDHNLDEINAEPHHDMPVSDSVDSSSEPLPAAEEKARPAVEGLALSPVWYIEPTTLPALAPEITDSNTLNYDPPKQWQTEQERAEPEVIIASLPEDDNVLDFDFGETELAADPVPVVQLTPPPELELEPEFGLDNFFASPALELTDELPATPPKIDIEYEQIAVFAPNNDEQATQRTEMDTKLGLAIEYQEIGYKEGARELINEVIQGGNPAQVEEAKEMLTKLA